MTSTFLNNHYLAPLMDYLVDQMLLTNWMKAHIKTSHSRKADAHHEDSARSFCFVILGERVIHYASAIKCLPDKFIVGILLHEIVHMIIEEKPGDPELGVDEWVIENLPEAGYEYKSVRYIDFTGKARTAKDLECVSEKFLKTIGI